MKLMQLNANNILKTAASLFRKPKNTEWIFLERL